MIKMTTQPLFQEHEIKETLGLVSESMARTRHIGGHFLAALRQIIGGEVKSYSKLVKLAREEALRRLSISAEEKGANALVGVKIEVSIVAFGTIQVIAYGTAVILKK